LQSYQKAACRLRVGKPGSVPDTVNPKKIAKLAPTEGHYGKVTRK
jgi:hypothetical protein